MNASFERGSALFSLGRYQLAELEIRQYLLSVPNDSSGLGLLALCRMNLGDLEEALSLARNGVESSPESAHPHYILSFIHHRRNELDQAEAAVAEAIRIRPDHATYYGLAARLRFRRQQWADCLQMAERGLEHDPKHAECLEFRLISLWELDRNDAFAETAAAAMEMYPDRAFPHFYRGRLCFRAGDAPAAEACYLEALRIDPAHEDARKQLKEAVTTSSPAFNALLRHARRMANARSPIPAILVLALLFGVFWTYLRRDHLTSIESLGMMATVVYILACFGCYPLVADAFLIVVLRWSGKGRLALSAAEYEVATIFPAFLLIFVVMGLVNLVEIHGK